MKISILLVFSILFCNGLYSQVLGQDKNGFSTIIQPSASFTLDLTDNVATLHFYQEHFKKEDPNAIDIPYDTEEMCLIKSKKKTEGHFKSLLLDSWKIQESIYKTRGFIYGIDLKGKSSDGITTLINNEQVLTSSTISGMIGLSWHKRSYIEGKELDEYVKARYNYKDESSDEEVKLIANIETIVNDLLEKKIITEGKKKELLLFKGYDSQDAKIKSLADRISTISNKIGFIDQDKETKSLNDRSKFLKKMLGRISNIQTHLAKYDAIANSNTNHQFDAQINVALDSLYKNTSLFDDELENKLIKPLNLDIPRKDLKKPSEWDSAKTTIDNALEMTEYNLYKIKSGQTTYSEESIVAAFQAYKSFLEKKEVESDDMQIAKGNTYTIQRNLVYFKG